MCEQVFEIIARVCRCLNAHTQAAYAFMHLCIFNCDLNFNLSFLSIPNPCCLSLSLALVFAYYKLLCIRWLQDHLHLYY